MPTDLAQLPTAPVGKKTVVMDIPMDLWLWASAQARQEGTNLTQKTIALYKRWREEVEAASAKPKARSAKAKKAAHGQRRKKQRQ